MLKKLLHQLSFEPPPQIIKMFKLCSGLGGFVRCIFFSKSKSINVGQMDNKSEHVGCPDPAIPLYLFSWLLVSLAAMLLLLLLVSYFFCVSWLYFEIQAQQFWLYYTILLVHRALADNVFDFLLFFWAILPT